MTIGGPSYVFGGTPVQPGEDTYIAYIGGENWTLGTNLALYWPFAFTSTGNPVRTTMVFQTADNPGNVILPNATEAAPGISFIMWNMGFTNINVSTYDGSSVVNTMAPNIAYWNVLTDNTTPAGEWEVVQFGAGTSGGTASALAGYGLVALPNPPGPQTLNVDFSTALRDTDFPLLIEDWGRTIICNDVCYTITLSDFSTSGVNSDGFFCYIYNAGEVPVVLHPSTVDILINGSNSDVPILPGFSCMLQFDGNESYTTIGLEISTTGITGVYTANVQGATPALVLSDVQLANQVIVITNIGTPLSTDLTIYFASANDQWIVHNRTNSAYNILLSAGSPTAPSGTIYPLPNQVASYFYVNATENSLYNVDLLPPPTNAADLIPLSYSVPSAGVGGTRWGGVAILQCSYNNSANQISIGTQNVIIVSLSLGAGTTITNRGVMVEGVVYISPELAGTETTYITVQKRIGTGLYTNLSTQGATALWAYVTTSNTYSSSDLIAVPFQVLDNITGPEVDVSYYILGNVTGGIAYANEAATGGITGISNLKVTVYGESAFA